MAEIARPDFVRDLAARHLASGEIPGIEARFEQSGRMRENALKPWMPFTARQTISTTTCAFDWRARSGPAKMIVIRDQLSLDAGSASVSILGILPIARAPASPQLNRAQNMRYLAELPWAPAAILGNCSLRWTAAGEKIHVATGSDDAAASVEFTLDSSGRISEVFAKDRPRAVKGGFVATPWIGRFDDYIEIQGAWIPHSAQVGWKFDERETIVWEGRIKSWEAR